jgi:MerR family redox-sensitive transcriptional activator SoxR
MGIGEVARRMGVRPSALRYYEQAGILPPAPKVNGQRRYDAALVRRLEAARFAQSVGFSLAEIRTLLAGPGRRGLSAQWRELAASKVAELDRTIAAARRMKRAIEAGLRCGCLRVEDCAVAATRRGGYSTRR